MKNLGMTPNGSDNQHNKLKMLVFLVLIILIISVIYQAWQKYYNLPRTLPVREKCDLHDKACKVRIPDGREVKFEITPKSIPTGKPLTLEVKLKNFNPNKASVFIASLDDIRGLHEVTLDKKSDDHYIGKITLEKSKSPNEGWLAIVHIYTAEDNITVPYQFSSDGKKPLKKAK